MTHTRLSTTNRAAAAIAGLAITVLALAGCTGNPNDPTTLPTVTETATPTPTGQPTYAPPADQDEAVAAAEDAVDRLLAAQAAINAAGGADASAYDDLATGRALSIYQADAQGINQGPTANEDGVNVDGESTTEGQITFTPDGGYGQDYEGTPNGLVILPGCIDRSDYVITTADGKPAYRPESDTNHSEFQVIYDTTRQLWLVYNQIGEVTEPC